MSWREIPLVPASTDDIPRYGQDAVAANSPSVRRNVSTNYLYLYRWILQRERGARFALPKRPVIITSSWTPVNIAFDGDRVTYFVAEES